MNHQDCKSGMRVRYSPSAEKWFRGSVASEPRQLVADGGWVAVLGGMEPAYGEWRGTPGLDTVGAAALGSVEPAPLVWLIGMNNPYSDDPADALLPYPSQSAGARLCNAILGMRRGTYIDAFERRNLLSQETWSDPLARQAAYLIQQEVRPNDRVVLLGEKVCRAWFGRHAPWRPFKSCETVGGVQVLPLPHPSGQCRIWNPDITPDAFGKARRALKELAPWVEVGA